MTVTPYLAGVAAIAVAGTYGLYAWTKRDLVSVQTQLEASTKTQACVSTIVEEVNQEALGQIAALTAEVDRQKAINAAVAAKSGERLRALNRLTKELANVAPSQNIPVSDHIERVLDELRRPSAGDAKPSGQPDKGDGGAADPAGHVVPAETVPAT